MGRTGRSEHPKGRHRVSQEDIDGMAKLRRRGLAHAEVGARFGLSERTARRYVGDVEPRLVVPGADDAASDAAPLREQFARELLDVLYKDRRLNALFATEHQTSPQSWEYTYEGPPSIIFLNEADRLIRKGLDDLGPAALAILARDEGLRRRFLDTIVRFLYDDYLEWHDVTFRDGPAPDDWRPPRERQGAKGPTTYDRV
jgi:hypothetical protein